MMWRGAEGLSKRTREVADRQSTLCGRHGKAEIAVKMLRKKINHSTLLPWRKSPSGANPGIKRRRVSLCHVGAEKQTEVIEEDLGKCFRRSQRWQDQLGQLMQDRIHRAVRVFQGLDASTSHIRCERIERGPRDVVVDPIDRSAIAGARIGLKIIDTHPTCGP